MIGMDEVVFFALCAAPFVLIGLVWRARVRAARAHTESWRNALHQLRTDRRAAQLDPKGALGSHGVDWVTRQERHHASLSFMEVSTEVEFGTSAEGNRPLLHWSLVVARLPTALDLGLAAQSRTSLPRVSPAGDPAANAWLTTLAEAFDSPGMPTGHKDVDDVMLFWAREPARLPALISSDLRRGLLGVRAGIHVSLTDTEVRLEHQGVMYPELALWMIHDAAWLAHALVEAAHHVPPSAWALQYRPIFEHAARALGLRYTLAPPMLGGVLGGVAVQCTLILGRVEDPPGLRLYAAFPRPLGLGLHLRPAQDGGLGLMRARDVQLGDALLDDKLDVHGDHPAAIQALFDARARALLHHLRDRGRIYVDDAGIRLESFGSADPRDLLPSLERVTELARLLTHRRSALPAT